ncbi:MAG: hypothetical protein DYG89_47640 [Caldilinea sp. CFX5]|nr:hypothetical protein [Caldilinea sp. CFX5]
MIKRYTLALLLAGGLLLLLYGVLTWPLAPVPVRAQDAGTPDQAGIEVKQTVGEAVGNCATTTVIAAPANRSIYYCVTLRNSGAVPLLRHTLAIANISTSFPFTLNPGQEIQVTNNVLSGVGATNSTILSRTVSSTPPSFTNTVTVTSTNAVAGVTASGKASVRVVVGTAAIRVTKTAAINDDCSGTRAIAVPISTTIKYCVIIQNIGTLPLTNHRLVDPLLKIDVGFPTNVPINASLRITDGNLRRIDSNQHLELFITGDLTNTLTVTSTTAEGAAATASNQATAIIGRSSMTATATLGLEDQCSTTTALTSLNGRTVYHCLRLTNNGTIPLEFHTIQWVQSTSTTPVVNTTITETVQPGQTLILTRSRITQFTQANVTAPANTNVTTNNFTVTSTNRRGFTARVQAQNQLTVNTQGVTLTKRPSIVSGSNCDPNISLTVGSTQDFYYCLIIQNNGLVPLVRHAIREGPPLNINTTFTYTLNASQRLTLTNDMIASTLKIPPFLGPFRAGASFPSTTTITSWSAANIAVTANAPLQVVVSTATPSVTPLPTQPPTTTPFPTTTPTPSFTPPPTPTPSPVVISFLPTPTQPFSVNAVATPTPGVAPGALPPTVDPFATPTFDPFAQPTSPLAFPTVDVVATFAAATFEAAATQTMIALLQPPVTDTPSAPLVESPLATPTITTTVALTATPVILVLTPIPTSVPPTGYLDVMAQVFQVSTATLGWLWFAIGSIIFFATAGMFAGLGWRSHRRRGLYEVNESADLTDDAMQLETDLPQSFTTQPLPTQAPTTRPPADRPPANRPPTNRPSTLSSADDDNYWPPSLR